MENLTDYGIWGLIALIAIKEIWPFFRDKLLPAKLKMEQAQENRITVALEGISKAVSALALGLSANNERLSTTNERISTLTELHLEHSRVSNEAITAMLVKTNTIPRRSKPVKKTKRAKDGKSPSRPKV